MKKMIGLLKKYLVIGLVLSSIFVSGLILSAPTPNVGLFYIIKIIGCVLLMAVVFIPLIAIADWLIIRTYKSIFNDFKNDDRSGRITIIIVSIGLFIKMIYEWDR
ncbi:hypothetical protein [Clostridium sp.]|uniref:hypothetical protein n=1 Tax=Clostridium sp. TaxID=1506 RepID=UPI0026114F71|nr:hypothetical protein [uncultured Clostridium sp.]